MKHLTRNLLAAGAMALSVGLTAGSAKAQEFINVLTGGTSGVYYPLGVALSEIYGQGIEGARAQVQATKASVENLNLLQAGRGEIAFTLGDSLRDGWEGNTEAGFPGKLDKLRGIAAIYPNYVQIVASKESGITSLEELKGKSLSVGAPASGTELNARAIFTAAGLTYQDLGKLEYLPFAESVELIKNRQLDSTLQSAGLGVASLRDLATSVPINVVAVSPEIVEKIGAPFVAVTIPAGTYEGQTEDVPTAAVGNFLVSHEGVSEETAYQMTKLMFENLDKMVASHAAAKAIDVQKAIEGMPLPLHPGAERYYREVGVLK
ncbi:TAXI family TRAP transporter solute-binding subunit [Aquamicrobium zhengzhouense]|uniref:TAXI family TRAP transporter solute-binding subunit n=1 Tax=Aquamicrobium zhengzhouense TaxID=2781738 RepID=A0ABS0SHM2_9HYPH|nr:TAXI family TRAP transporter solute-binding subunit [Aquamicrobium zhengzhouense]MBI1622776.1 TAXI family TRAP transporter solute-binding subunit [Aquamicrobium zhengzhouense]